MDHLSERVFLQEYMSIITTYQLPQRVERPAALLQQGEREGLDHLCSLI